MTFEMEMVWRLLLATALGAAIGYQRERVGKPVGLRTHALISAGAALFTLAGIYAFPGGDTSRIAAGVVTGIGFLGAGAIIRHRDSIVGLTTSASVWAVAAIGVAAGAGMYILSAVTAAIILIILFLPHRHFQ
jgi:putative Mg2+ transporter-C (MgtC) family protein